jgi:hypothetical protein
METLASHTASAPPRVRRAFPDRLLRGVALMLLSVLLFYLKTLTTVVRMGIGAIRKVRTSP